MGRSVVSLCHLIVTTEFNLQLPLNVMLFDYLMFVNAETAESTSVEEYFETLLSHAIVVGATNTGPLSKVPQYEGGIYSRR
jgi:hypothetical protein